ncbi:AraC family transcriptional regulator [Paenibacillus gansuensis]|uniref:AraC family transcriptional regulator n=1 Tax=Paenibacillus gansuensis TaxID=306542 RepID=A0ABW5PG31_9BACL
MADHGHIQDTFASNPSPSQGELSVLFSGWAQTEPSHKFGPVVHDYIIVHLVMSGKGIFHNLGKDYALSAGDSFFILPGDLVYYQADYDDPWKYTWIAFRGAAAEELLLGMDISVHRPVVTARNLRKMQLYFTRIIHTLQQGGNYTDLEAGGYLRLLLGEYGASNGNSPQGAVPPATMIQQQVEQAIRWITLQYYQPISIENMAKTLGYHRTHLSKMFKQYTGLSPMNYLLKVRMERAQKLLGERLTIDQVASSVGFTDPLYFSKQFKKWNGCSPSEYRASLQGSGKK